MNMIDRFQDLLDDHGGYYHVEDIMECIDTGRMQSFSDGHSWAITQVNTFPRKKVLEILYVIGEKEALSGVVQEKIETFARSIDCTEISAAGRFGWDKVKTAGWEKQSVNYIRRL